MREMYNTIFSSTAKGWSGGRACAKVLLICVFIIFMKKIYKFKIIHEIHENLVACKNPIIIYIYSIHLGDYVVHELK